MLQRSFVVILTIVFAAAAVAAQRAPSPPNDKERVAEVFSYVFDGQGSYLGVQTKEVSAENHASFGLRTVQGVAIEKVIEGSPAEKAGLAAGDVILRFNGEEVTSSRKLTRLVGEVAPDHNVRLTISRGGSEREVMVTIAKRPSPKFEQGLFTLPETKELFERGLPEFKQLPELPRVFTVPPGDREGLVWRMSGPRQIGIGIVSLTKQLAEHFGVSGGVMINNVRENSPASRAGLRAGDIIVEIDGKDVTSDMDVIRAVSEKKEGDVTITIVRAGNRQTVRVTPEESKGGFEGLLEFPPAPRAPVQVAPPRQISPVPLNQLVVSGRVI